ncbi:hypothetical protein B0T26DRAFT_743278 [Lasiosphaeria miniovina]|uniref:Nucleoside 2-deoxyribosyltransferase-like protein n=1 Tax=Lasiosphaeria miniovina TaxID=1954250 RepID=A0AA40A6C1_9PEZI|nr:uncharacterized protein B0T26DRAFT_743278 [Lasiosphaeria miniovina]KAK0710067.1 hypothetical protein B0T26DRAFT_743278 [Lasiosphaeria miniovina]
MPGFVRSWYRVASQRTMSDTSQRKAQVVLAPSRPAVTGKKSVFLAGTTSRTGGPEWRDVLADALAHLPVTIFNPLRHDWDSTWREDIDFAPFREQVEWELDMQERADVVVVYYGPATDAPISLLELGLCARSAKAIVACHKDYRKRGNVYIVSQRLGIEFLDAEDDLAASVINRLKLLLAQGDSA